MDTSYKLTDKLSFYQAFINKTTTGAAVSVIGLVPKLVNIPNNAQFIVSGGGAAVSSIYYVFYVYNNVNKFSKINALYSVPNGGTLYCNGISISNITPNNITNNPGISISNITPNNITNNPGTTTPFYQAQSTLININNGYNLITFAVNGNTNTNNNTVNASQISGVIGTFWSQQVNSSINVYNNYLFCTDETWYSCPNDTIMNFINDCFINNLPINCNAFFNALKMKTLSQEGYSCNKNIGKGKIAGKVISTNNGYNIVFNNNQPVLTCESSINQPPTTTTLQSKTCLEAKQQIFSEMPTLCEQSFTTYNLYPSTNPLVIKGNNIREGIKSTFPKTNSSTSPLYTKYSSVYPDKNSTFNMNSWVEGVLNEHPIKMGCCLYNQNNNKTNSSPISVLERVPLNPYNKYSAQQEKFNFAKANLTIPSETCPTKLYNGSPACNAFMDINCENIFNYMNSEGISVQNELLNYAPECACYAPNFTLITQQYAKQNIPANCYKTDCSQSNPNVYIDASSRSNSGYGPPQPCQGTWCNNIVQINDLNANAGNNVTISPQLQNECGAYLKTGGTTTGGSTTGGTTGGSTTGGTTGGSTTGGSSTGGTSINGGSNTGGTSTTGSTSKSDASNNTLMVVVIIVIVLIFLLCSSTIVTYLFITMNKSSSVFGSATLATSNSASSTIPLTTSTGSTSS